MNYIALENKSALHKVKGKFPFSFELNIYRGCEHCCQYCFALYSHNYINDSSDNFFECVYYKKNVLEYLEKELSKPTWKKDVISIGGITDSYQPIEGKLKLMREVLKLMIKYKNPIIISTKSTLILRDLDLINELASLTYVNIAFTITTIDEEIRKKLEPGASPSLERFKALKKFRDSNTNAHLAVHIMPIIPYLTDKEENLSYIYLLASRVPVDYVLPAMLNLRGKTKEHFYRFLRNYDIDIYKKLHYLFQNKELKKIYRKKLYQNINYLKKKYHMNSDYMCYSITEVEQLSLDLKV